ncbi:MAG: hypothetical protein PHW18_05230 [Sulfuricurvum sp.]|uniref:hypothetical protein n=1 Tax=Sulfuricurvum sp. TaxID=2025608 RepID=UPI0026376E1E|nr:hypothetical protein [Sulfuricurvum sp.]MDD2828958.1 hypothetical protein [Sulfuricurvum sp.]MDD4950057.1 hypothetical protein [Sulfuricurvum sp.]
MKKIPLLLLLLTTFVWGSKILSYNVYDRHERVDVMLTFDTPYEGVLRQNQQGQTITIKLEEASIDSPLNKTINSTYLQNITIAPSGDQIIITAKVSNNVLLQASKTSDSYGLRLRFSPPATAPALNETDNEATGALPTKDESEFERSYYVVIGILIVGIIILFWLKQGIAKKATALHSEPKAPWLFNSLPKKGPSPTLPIADLDSSGIQIRFQKTLDPSHSVAMLDFGTMSYLVLLGNNTILLDKFQDNIPITQNEFEALLQTKHRELDGYFQLAPAQDEVFDAYKEKASLI